MAGKFGGVEEYKLVDEASGKSGGIESRPGFEQDAENFAAAKFLQYGGEINHPGASLHLLQFDTGILQFARFSGTSEIPQ